MTRNVALGRILLPMIALGYLAAGLYPFNWFSPFAVHENFVEWTTDGAFSFPEQGIAYTETAPEWVSTAIQQNAFQVTLEVIPYEVSQSGPARIFTLSGGNHARNLTIGQDAENLAVRLRTTRTGLNGTPDFEIPGVFRELKPRRITVQAKSGEIRVRVDGRQRLAAALPPDTLSNWSPGYRLALGNEMTFQRSWRGEIKTARVRVRDQEFTYTGANLHMPASYDPDPRFFLAEIRHFFSLSFSRAHLTDWIVNIIGFVPLGFLIARVRRETVSVALVCTWCAALSLSIEVGQLFLEDRSSQVSDLILNTLGGATGVWISNMRYEIPAPAGR